MNPHRIFSMVLAAILILFTTSTKLSFAKDGVIRFTLEQCIKKSLETSEQYKISFEKVKIAEYEFQEASALEWRPDISLGLDAHYFYKFNNEGQIIVPYFSNWNFDVSLTIKKIIWDGGFSGANTTIKEKSFISSLLEREKIKKEIILKIKLLFFNILLNKEILSITKDSLELTIKNEQIARKNYETGILSKLDYQKTKIILESAKIDYINAYNKLKTLKLELIYLVDKNSISYESINLENIDFIGKLEEKTYSYNLKESIEKGLKNRPEIKQIQINKSIIEKKISKSESEYSPIVSIYGTFSFNLSQAPDPNNISIFYTSKQVYLPQNYSTGDFKPNFSISLGIQILFPISNWFPGSSSSAKVDQAKHSTESEKYMFDNVKSKIIYDITDNYLTMENVKENIGIRKSLVDIAKENLDLAEKLYKKGNIDYINYMDVILQYNKVRLDYLNEIYSYNFNRSKFLYSIGEEE